MPHRGERRNRAPRHAEFRIVVVFDDEAAARPIGGKRPRLIHSRPVEQIASVGGGHDDPCRELVSGHHMRHARAAFTQYSDVDASRRKRNARAARALGIVHALEQRIPRGFYRESAIAPQQLDYQLIERLRSRCDDDALGGDIHAAVFAQVSGDYPTQARRPSAESGLRERCGRLLCKRPAHHASPGLIGEKRRCRRL